MHNIDSRSMKPTIRKYNAQVRKAKLRHKLSGVTLLMFLVCLSVALMVLLIPVATVMFAKFGAIDPTWAREALINYFLDPRTSTVWVISTIFAGVFGLIGILLRD
jgi:hypothetical protein